MSTRVEHLLTALCLDDDGEILGRTDVRLVYERNDPWAVSLHFPHARSGYVIWTVARCLLSEGLNQVMGDCDFRVTPGGGMVRIELRSPQGSAAFALDIDEMEEFVLAAFALVPEGTERRHVDFEALTRQLVGGSR